MTGAPFISGSPAFLDCRVTQTISAGKNSMFIAEVLAVRGVDQDSPLVHHGRAYRQLKE